MQTIHEYAAGIFAKLPPVVASLAFVGGGCFRSFYDGTPVKDYDLFFTCANDWDMAVRKLAANPNFTEVTAAGEGCYPSFIDNTGAMWNLIGFRFHNNIADLALSFDFHCCAFAARRLPDGSVDVNFSRYAMTDATAKVLRFQNHQHIDRVTRRVEKYKSYGYIESTEFIDQLSICRSLPRSTSAGGGY